MNFKVIIPLCLFLAVHCCVGLYQDQVGKYDWKKSYVGKVTSAAFETSVSMSKHLFVVSEKNVLACLSTKTGNIVWRQMLEEREGKVVKMMHTHDGLVVVTSSGLARIWEPSSGILKWEIDFAATAENEEEFVVQQVAVLEQSYSSGNLLVALSNLGVHTLPLSKHSHTIKSSNSEVNIDNPQFNQLFVDSESGRIFHLQLQLRTGIIVNIYDAKEMESVTKIIVESTWLDSLNKVAVLEGNILVYSCQEGDTELLYVVDLGSGKTTTSVKLRDLEIESVSSLVSNDISDMSFKGTEFLIQHGQNKVTLLKLDESDIQVGLTKVLPGLADVVAKSVGSEFYGFFTVVDKDEIGVSAMNLKKGIMDEGVTIKYRLHQNVGSLKNLHVNMFLKRSSPVGIRGLVTTTADTIILLTHPNRVAWQRDEALASIKHASMLDLPLSDADAGIEVEFDENPRSRVVDMFLKRVKAQIVQVTSFVKQTMKEIDEGTFFKHKTRDPLIQVEGMTRDPFSLHKMIVALTTSGCIFGIDSLSGNVVWRYFSPALKERTAHFYVQRTTAHFPHPPQALILAIDPNKQVPPVLLALNPITGDVTDKTDELDMKSPVMQVTLLPTTDANHLRPLLIVDTDLKVHLFPCTDETRALLVGMDSFMYDINPDSGLVRGFVVGSDGQSKPTWTMAVPETHKIIASAGKPAGEKVDSLGRPLADRSVMFKYLNPNAVVILSESYDRSVDRSSLMVHLIDAVTGNIIHSMVHKKASGPVHVVHSENWLIYSYKNTKARRTEIAGLELYEGKSQFNNTAFSSFHARPSAPMVIHQAYIFPMGVTAMGVSRTDKAITSRQILLALNRGSIFGIPRRFFDPRRPLHAANTHREEGLIPYAPEIPILPEWFLSYNLTVEGITGIYCAPAALESTSLVLATGLDIFFTRTQPSKMFDVLKEDFDHFFISAVLAAMLAAALITRRWSQVKQVNKAWK